MVSGHVFSNMMFPLNLFTSQNVFEKSYFEHFHDASPRVMWIMDFLDVSRLFAENPIRKHEVGHGNYASEKHNDFDLVLPVTHVS